MDDAARLLDERPDYAKKADPDVESNAKSKAENEYKDKTDSNKDEKIKVYTEALVITETADAIDKPINTLMADLTALAGRNAKAAVSFKYAPNNKGIGHYKVWMNPPLKDDYTDLSIWSSTKNKTPVENAYSHYKKHKYEFPEMHNAKKYVDDANEFMKNPPEGTLIKTRVNGDEIFFNPQSNKFAIRNSYKEPKTFFIPDPSMHGYSTNLDYFNAQ